MALRLKRKSLTLIPIRSLSSSSSNGDPSFSSPFSDIKQSLRSPSPPPPLPNSPPPRNPNPPQSPSPSTYDVRKVLNEFRLKSPNPNPNSSPLPGRGRFEPNRNQKLSFDSIRESMNHIGNAPRDPNPKPKSFQFDLKAFSKSLNSPSARDRGGPLPDSIFGPEMREKPREKATGSEEKGDKTKSMEFIRMYSYVELGEKLRELRPAEAAGEGKDWFSLEELNGRLEKLREIEEKETDNRMGGTTFNALRESLRRLKVADQEKKVNRNRLSFLANLTTNGTPGYMLKPPQDQLVDNYFHPDHLSSEEKMKIELKKVRDEFKMSESDCGSSRVQIAQLTTKIKHLSSVLHKKDKHSRKGLHDMVQRRKKLLKYLRRTDWDSYCFVLSKLGLRDVPEYKTPNYKA